jgi:hypothetical protein
LLLQPKQRYHGEEYHKIALQEQHNTFLSVYKNLKKAKLKQASYADKIVKSESQKKVQHVKIENVAGSV